MFTHSHTKKTGSMNFLFLLSASGGVEKKNKEGRGGGGRKKRKKKKRYFIFYPFIHIHALILVHGSTSVYEY